MFQVHNLAYTQGERLLFQGVTFHLGPGKKMALIGRNGCGKTTLMRLLAGQEHPDAGQIQMPRAYRRGYLDQHRHFHTSSALEEVTAALAPSYHGLSYRAEQILIGLGLGAERWHTSPDKLSGGYRLRLALATLLAQEPELLLLDEPTNYLDLPSVLWLGEFLKNHPSSAVVISHDRSFLDRVCDYTAGIHGAQFYQVEGSTQEYFAQLLRLERAQNHLQQKIEAERSRQEAFIERFGAKATKATQARARAKQLEKLPEIKQWVVAKELSIQLRAEERPLPRLITTQQLAFSYDRSPLIGPIDLEWGQRQRLAFVGANGRGKSTLLNLLLGELTPLSGQVQRHSLAKLGYFGQRAVEQLDTAQTPLQLMVQATWPLQSESKARAQLGAFGLEGAMQERLIGTLSGGERSRLLLALLAAQPTHGLILDEPTHHLDIETVESLLHAIDHYAGAVILVSHCTATLEAFAPDQLLLFESSGQSWYRGSYDQWLESQLQEQPRVNRAGRGSKGADSYQQAQERKRQLANLRSRIAAAEQAIAQCEKQIPQLHQQLAQAHLSCDRVGAQRLTQSLLEWQAREEEQMALWSHLSKLELELGSVESSSSSKEG